MREGSNREERLANHRLHYRVSLPSLGKIIAAMLCQGGLAEEESIMTSATVIAVDASFTPDLNVMIGEGFKSYCYADSVDPTIEFTVDFS